MFWGNKFFILTVTLVLLAFGCGNPVAHIPELNKGDFASVPTTPKPPQLPAAGGYRLLPYDVISVKYTYHPEQDPKGPIALSPDGNVILEGIGPIQAVGLTTDELGKAIAEKTSARLKDPEVIVTVVTYSPKKIYVGGEVRNPGIVIVQDNMTPLQAILDRGGFTGTAQMDSVILIRDAASGNPKIGRMNLSQALENAAPEQVTLLSNDVIYVPMSGIGRADLWVKQHIKDLIPWEVLRPPTATDLFIR
jgi:protein involved in polysaccharide export with SLBB domain